MTINDHRSSTAKLPDIEHVFRSAITTSNNFTIFEGTSEIQRLIIGRAATGLDVR